MSKSVVLSLGSGSLTTGFPYVRLELHEPNHTKPIKFSTSLPAASDLSDLYRRWQMIYGNYYRYLNRREHTSPIDPDFEIDEADTTHFSESEFEQVCQQLSDRLNAWLDCTTFRQVDRQLYAHLNPADEIHFTIEAEDHMARRLPWCLWRFFTDYPHTEVELSSLDYQRPLSKLTGSAGVKILVILGDSTGIDVEGDRRTIAAIPGARPEFLVEPKATELSDRLWAKGWDILFFAGHSSSQKDEGRIYINPTESLTIAELRPALRTAIANGLKLAIFNSCDGLKLASDLADLHISATIVMREPVPDRVAQAFLRYFLPAFAQGKSLHQAFRQAREQLHVWQREFPCAAWLPTLIRNPAEESPTWIGLLQKSNDRFSQRPFWLNVSILLVCSAVVAGLMIQVRKSGILQTAEQKAYDYAIRLQGTAPAQNSRFLIIRVTPEDLIPSRRSEEGRLTDQTLAELLRKLRQYQPALIGLDIYRDRPVGSGNPKLIRQYKTELTNELKKTPQLIAVCKASDKNELTREGYQTAEGIQQENIVLSDLTLDSDGIARRHLIQMKPEKDSSCQAEYPLGTMLSFKYLKQRKIAPSRQDFLQLGSIVFKNLQAPIGIYQQTDTRGYQVLLHYRPYHKLDDIAPNVTLSQVLGDDIKPEQFRGKIVLIGYDDDGHLTPYALEEFADRKTPGMFIHAQMADQIISAVLEGRSLLQFLPDWADNLWIWSWAVSGGVVVWRWQLSRNWWLVILTTIGVLCLFCWGSLLLAYWIPLVPAVLALLTTSGLMSLALRIQRSDKFVTSTLKSV